ncbi:hypothetical protein DPMN_172540 [Dreissena polymorpha]|uniref:Uncharacterized protein n=1 Tax=Dreissena polymorpha TaxID=45954 RepID=A0A9D4IDF0_DREPO|nr:hypothetical protein DPMN_172540 [Dreissena polymorpha]
MSLKSCREAAKRADSAFQRAILRPCSQAKHVQNNFARGSRMILWQHLSWRTLAKAVEMAMLVKILGVKSLEGATHDSVSSIQHQRSQLSKSQTPPAPGLKHACLLIQRGRITACRIGVIY